MSLNLRDRLVVGVVSSVVGGLVVALVAGVVVATATLISIQQDAEDLTYNVNKAIHLINAVFEDRVELLHNSPKPASSRGKSSGSRRWKPSPAGSTACRPSSFEPGLRRWRQTEALLTWRMS